MSKFKFIALFLVIISAFFLRFHNVTSNPPSLNWDEVSIGYNAYSILKTGKDEWGEFMPLHFKSYGEYKLPGQIYASIPGIALFGLNELGVRITPVIYGTLSILFLFFLVRNIFSNDWIGIGASFLLTVSPWHIHLTRASFESSFAVFWILLGLWFLVKGFRDPKWFYISMVAFALSVYTYNSARVFTPLFLLTVFIIYFKSLWKNKKEVFISIAIFGILMFPLVPFVLSGEGSARYKLVSVTDDPGLVLRVNEGRGNSALPGVLPLLVHNKYSYAGVKITQNYLAHFSPQFLFINGAPHKQHHVQNIGELYLVQVPFLLLGFYILFKSRNKFRWMLISWLVIAFIPVSTTNDSIPHALRTLIAAPFYQILTALGFAKLLDLLKHRRNLSYLMSSVFIIGFTIQFSYYLNNYYRTYPILYSRDWQYGYKEVVEFIKVNYEQYDKIVFTRHWGEPHMFSLFYLKYDPQKFRDDPKLNRFETYDWIRVLAFDKFYFPDLGDKGTQYNDIKEQLKGQKVLFIGKYNDFPAEVVKLKTVRFLNGDIAFEIVDNT